MAKDTHQSKIFFYISLLLGLGGLAIFAVLLFRYQNQNERKQQAQFDYNQQQALQAAIQVDTKVHEFMAVARSVADDLSDGTLPYDQVESRLARETRANPDIFGITASFEPFAYAPDIRLYAPYYKKSARGFFEKVAIESVYDYTVPPDRDPSTPDTTWYHQPVTEGAGWIEPYFGSASNTLLATYGVPFYRLDTTTQQEVPAGAVAVALSLAEVQDLVDSLDLGATGYGYIISSSGLFIAHPIKEYIGQKTIFELARDQDDDMLQSIGKRAVQGEEFVQHMVDQVTGQESLVFHVPVQATGWSVGIIMNREEMILEVQETMFEQVMLALVLALALMFIAMVAFRVHRKDTLALWGVSVTTTLLNVAIIGFVWHLASFIHDETGVQIVNRSGLDRFLLSYEQEQAEQQPVLHGESLPPAVHIPTGIVLHTIQFGGPNDVTIGGYIWQKYPENLDPEIARGFVFPQRGGWDIVTKVYHRHEHGMEIVGWQVLVPLREAFNPAKYPFDNEDIQIRLRHKDFDKNVILVPDIESYDLLKPSLLPGLDDEMVIEGRMINESFFSYHMFNYDTNFGFGSSATQRVPELYFNVRVQRSFLDSLVGQIIPLLIIFMMMFIVVFITNEPDSKEIFGVLSYSAALFFVAGLAHSGLRQKIAALGITYFEYFYILIYIVILAVSVNAILYHSQSSIRFLQFRNNLLPKIAYGPLVSGVLLVVTLYVFVFNEETLLYATMHSSSEEQELLRIGMITDAGGIEDKSFNQNIWKGLQRAASELDNVEVAFVSSDDEADYEQNIVDMAEQHYNIIVTVGYGMAAPTFKLAETYPHIQFILVDHPTQPELKNVQGVLFAVDEAATAVGYLAAAMADKTDPSAPMVGYVAGERIPPVEQFIVGYQQGIWLYNSTYHRNVAFTGVYVGDFVSLDKGIMYGRQLIADGADVLMGVGGITGNGGIAAAKNAGKLAIGVDVDQYETLTNERDILLTSTMKRLDEAIFALIAQARAGDFAGGTNYVGSFDNGGVGMAPFHAYEQGIPDAIRLDLDKLTHRISQRQVWTGWGDIGGSQVSNTQSGFVATNDVPLHVSQQVETGSGSIYITLELPESGQLTGKAFVIPTSAPFDVSALKDMEPFIVDDEIVAGDETQAVAYTTGDMSMQADDATVNLTGVRNLRGQLLVIRSYYHAHDEPLLGENLHILQEIQLEVPAQLPAEDLPGQADMTIGIIQAADTPANNAAVRGFQNRLRELGFSDSDIGYDIHIVGNDARNMKQIVSELVDEDVDMIYTPGLFAAQTTNKAIQHTPLIFSAVSDPVAAGLVESLDMPGKNASGVAGNVTTSLFDVIVTVLPTTQRLGIVYNPTEHESHAMLDQLQAEARQRNMQIVETRVLRGTAGEIARLAQGLVGQVDAIYVAGHMTLGANEEYLVDICNEQDIPLFASSVELVANGAVASLSIDHYNQGYEAGKLASRVLSGADPATIRVHVVDEASLWVNPAAAASQGVTIPDTLLQQADRVVE